MQRLHDEGASSYIEICSNSIVQKRAKRHGIRSMTIINQFILQRFAHSISQTFDILYVPAVFECRPKQYTMELIDVRTPIDKLEAKALDEFQQLAAKLLDKFNVKPFDYELYKQPNGRIALIDFDQFIQCSSETQV